MSIVALHPALSDLRIEPNGVITALEKLRANLSCLAAMSPADRPLLDIAAKFVPLAIAAEWANLYDCALDDVAAADPSAGPAADAAKARLEAASELVHPHIDTIKATRANGPAGLMVKVAAMLSCHGDDLRKTFMEDGKESSDRSLQASFSLDILDMLDDLPEPGSATVAALPAPDCELVTLAAQFESALEVARGEHHACDEREAAIQTTVAVPEALRFRDRDQPMLARLGLGVPASGVYDQHEIYTLRQVSPFARDAEFQRAREIVEAYELREAAVDKARTETGAGAPDEELDKVLAPSDALRDTITETPATTLEGLAAKAVVACDDFDGGFGLDAPNEIVCRSLLADLLRIAGRLPADEAAMTAVPGQVVTVMSETCETQHVAAA